MKNGACSQVVTWRSDKSWVAGIELAAAGKPQSVGPRPEGVDLRLPTAANRTCYPLMYHARIQPDQQMQVVVQH